MGTLLSRFSALREEPSAPAAEPPHATFAKSRAVYHFCARRPLACAFAPTPAHGYDFARSTRDNYAAEHPGRNLGPFAQIRDALDVDYHGNYTPERQRVQDDLVAQALAAEGASAARAAARLRSLQWLADRLSAGAMCAGAGGLKAAQAHPWIIFTAGPMGAGKSRTMSWLCARGIVPLEHVVCIDADSFRTALPEWRGYVARDATSAGARTRREAGYLVEIATEAALRLRQHVWVDGSLRDGEWYAALFGRIREAHPEYQIAILYVTAADATVRARAARRAAKTGRHVPEAELADSLARVPGAVRRLTPLADLVAEIVNDGGAGDAPVLARLLTPNGGCDPFAAHAPARWEELASRFRPLPHKSRI
jgi:hypothetical protein